MPNLGLCSGASGARNAVRGSPSNRPSGTAAALAWVALFMISISNHRATGAPAVQSTVAMEKSLIRVRTHQAAEAAPPLREIDRATCR